MYRRDDIIFCGHVSGLYWEYTFESHLPQLFRRFADMLSYISRDLVAVIPSAIGSQYCCLIDLAHFAGIELDATTIPYCPAGRFSAAAPLASAYSLIMGRSRSRMWFEEAIGHLTTVAGEYGYSLEECVDRALMYKSQYTQ